MDNKYLTIVDIGSYITRACTVSVVGDDVQTIAYRQALSQGVSEGKINNIRKCSEVIKDLIGSINSDIDIQISKVVTGISLSVLDTYISTVRTERPDPDMMIEEEEMEDLRDILISENTKDKEVIIQTIPIIFRVGDFNECPFEDTIGMTGEFIEGVYRVFSASQSVVNNIYNTFKQAGIEVEAIYPIGMATPEAVLYDHEKASGVAVIEIGAETSSVEIYHNDVLRYVNSISFGGQNITNDIAQECHFTKELAESIKRDYGYATPERISSLSEKSLQIRMRDGRHIELPIKYLSEIIESRCLEIFNALLYYIEDSTYADIIPSGIVLTGGSANLSCIADLLRNISGYPVRIATPLYTNVRNSIRKIDDSSASTIVGLLNLAVANNTGLEDAKPPVPVAEPEPVAEPSPAPAQGTAERDYKTPEYKGQDNRREPDNNEKSNSLPSFFNRLLGNRGNGGNNSSKQEDKGKNGDNFVNTIFGSDDNI